MRPETLRAIQDRIDASRVARATARELSMTGQWRSAEPDAARRLAYDARVSRVDGAAEAVYGSNDFQPVVFLPDGATVRRAVGRVQVQSAGVTTSGSGFLLSPDLFITNQHVVMNAADAANTVVVFDDEIGHGGTRTPQTRFSLAPGRLALFSDEDQLDYAIVALGGRIDGAATAPDLGYCPLGFSPDRHRIGMNVNIIQHPNALPKTIAIRNNLLTARTDTRLLYETDTDVGSSGSPVFNDQWDIVALHHYGAPSAAAAGAPPNPSVNEGIRISAIFEDLKQRATTLPGEQQSLVLRALSLWTDATPGGKQLEHRPPAPPEALISSVAPHDTENAMPAPTADAATLVIPLEVTIRVAGARAATIPASPVDANAVAPRRRLTRTAEAVKLDTDYTNRNGFNPKFVPGVNLDLDKIAKPKADIIAPLHAGEAVGAEGELRYQNFSVIMHKRRCFALLTATNIDGDTYVSIDRKTGLPSTTQPEGETWIADTRISDSYTVNQDFYSAWSHLFDRGHLTRRDDPTWGPDAVRANKDTFHFTNCTPQHWLFNESIKYWQGVERYVLEQGLFVSGKDKPLSVLQGPVFDNTNDQWADNTQVPSAFWKVVIWNGKTGLKAAAFIVDQTRLLTIERGGGSAPPPAGTPVNVTEYRASVAEIEKRTGLDLSAIRAHDTAAQTLPTVGEALRIITKWEDIALK